MICTFSFWSLHMIISIIKPLLWYEHNIAVFLMTSLTSSHQILDKHTIVDMFWSKWNSHCIPHLTLRLRCEIAEKSILDINLWQYLAISSKTFILSCYYLQVHVVNFYKQYQIWTWEEKHWKSLPSTRELLFFFIGFPSNVCSELL